MGIKLLTRGPLSPTKVAIHEMIAADGAWVGLSGEHQLVISPQCRYYWQKKLHCKIQVGKDTDGGAIFGRLVHL